MDILLVLTYLGICILVFKVFKVPLTKWTVPTAVFIGVILIGTLMLAMNYNHPASHAASRTFITTPIMPNVRGLVTEVPVSPNQPVTKGDVLFKIDPTPFQEVVNQKQAALDSARAMVDELNDTVNQLNAEIDRATASRDLAQEAFDSFSKVGTGGVSALQIENRRQLLSESEASLTAARAAHIRAKHQLESQNNNAIPQAQAELERARFDLDSTTVTAPADGYVTQLTLRRGMMAVPLPLRPVMVFVNKQENRLIANFRQNSLRRIADGSKAEVLFPSLPGKVFQAKVDYTMPVLAEGELQAQGKLISAQQLNTQGLVPVVIHITDEKFPADKLPLGINGQVAIYSEHLESLSIIRKVLFRMKSWKNFLYFDH
ncbi:HlyD family secretion protein [Rubritalea spongiae]|uniref:HlyD family secretion protein n=1 Tax=Rubritalea spongiae TaxID=430797 RepID=A0ABW5DYL2_9BACT